MKDKLLKLAVPIGVLSYILYTGINRFIVKIPDIIAIPFCIFSILLIVVGLVYNRLCSNKDQKANNLKK